MLKTHDLVGKLFKINYVVSKHVKYLCQYCLFYQLFNQFKLYKAESENSQKGDTKLCGNE